MSFSSLGLALVVSLLITSAPARGQKIWVQGHRGSRGTHPENTMPAFREAVAAGVDAIELDLQIASDGTLIVSHDPVIDKLCRDAKGKIVKRPIPIASLTAAEIATYDCGGVANPEFPNQKLVPKTPKPAFEDVLRWVVSEAPAAVELNVETKMDAVPPFKKPEPRAFAMAVVAMLRKYDVVDRTMLESFDHRTLEEARQLSPTLRLSALYNRPLVHGLAHQCREAAEHQFTIVSPDFHAVTESAVRECHELGLQVLPWTPDTPKDWKRLAECDVDGIITDYPRALLNFLHQP